MASAQQRQSGLRQQPLVLLIVVLVLCSAMVSRLVWMQLLEGSRFKQLADENRIRLVPRSPIRGRLLDRKGRVLATSKLTYSLFLEPRLVSDANWPGLRNRLASLLNLDLLLLDQRRDRGTDRDGYRTTLLLDLKPEQVLRFREQASTLPGAQVDVDFLRFYPHGSLAAHALGYTAPITEKEYKTLYKRGYNIRDRIGRTGVEHAYESYLRGRWGGQMLEVNAMGEVQRYLGDRPSKAGQDLILTLDLDLQRIAEQSLADKPGGAVVALEASTGAVLALASKPSFDPNFFSRLIKPQKEYDALFNNPKDPMLSRALNPYEPGSTWKPVTAMAGMESGKFPPNTKLHTKACITYGGHCFVDHNDAGFGHIGYADALRFSSNTFFYQVGVGVGSRAMKNAADALGFQQKTGIEFSWEENIGLVGDEDWAAKGRPTEFNDFFEPGTTPWIPEDMASASIGQSVVQITPLQLARAYAVFANGGWLVTPHLYVGGKDWIELPLRRKVAIKPSTLDTIRAGLRKVVQSETGASLNGPGIPPAAGKTGTADDSSGGSAHAWFASYAPYPEGEIVVVAFVQNAGGGGSVHALPIAKKVLAAWEQSRQKD